jgi:hypothetical protein
MVIDLDGGRAKRVVLRGGDANPTWRVVRQDDNGNVFIVADRLAEDFARELCVVLERRAHKQIYMVEPTGAVPAVAGARREA